MRFTAPRSVLIALTVFLPFASGLEAASGPTAVQNHLVKGVEGLQKLSQTFVKDGAAYDAIIAKYNGDYSAAYKAEAVELKSLVEVLREDFNALDLEYHKIKSTVGGVPTFAAFAIYLDTGVAAASATPELPSAPVALYLRNGEIINQEGALFTNIIEPMLWGNSPAWIVPVDLNDDGTLTNGEALPKTEALTVAAADANKKIGELLVSAKIWQPTSKDCFDALIATLSQLPGSMGRWKSMEIAEDSSGLLPALGKGVETKSVVNGLDVLYDAVEPLIRKKDKSLAKAIAAELKELGKLADRIVNQDKTAAGKWNSAEIDETARDVAELTTPTVALLQQAMELVEPKVEIPAPPAAE